MATRIAPINPNIRRNNDCALHALNPTQRCRVLKAMKSNKGEYPIDLSLLREDAVVQIADALAQLVEHLC